MSETSRGGASSVAQPSPRVPSLLDQVLPRCEFQGEVSRVIHASPGEAFAALRAVTLADMPLANALGNLRYLPGRLLGRTPPSDTSRPFWELIEFRPLLEDADREVVIGSIGRLHDLTDQQMVRIDGLDAFRSFQHPDYQKLAMSIRAEPGPMSGTTRLVLEHRTLPLGASARWKFALYWWLLVSWASGLMGGLLLDAVKRRAEGERPAADEPRTIGDAVRRARASGLRGWALVEFVQHLAARRFTYSRRNPWDTPERAFRRGQGYCQQQALALKAIYDGLGIRARPVYAMRCWFPESVIHGIPEPAGVSGHVWLRVSADGDERDVCCGSVRNRPGQTAFRVLSPVRELRPWMQPLTHLGSVVENWRRDMAARRRMRAPTGAADSAAKPSQRGRPTKLTAAFLRVPVLLYRLGLGPLLAGSTLVLTTRGRRTGCPRRTPLGYVRDGGTLYVQSGRGERADWYRNVVADPVVVVRLGAERFPARAEVIRDPAELHRLQRLAAEQALRHAPPRPVLAVLHALGRDFEATVRAHLEGAEPRPAVALRRIAVEEPRHARADALAA